MNNIFLVTTDGERHEDHVPQCFVDWEHFCKKFVFESNVTEESLSDGNWHKVSILDTIDYDFEEQDIKNMRELGLPFPSYDIDEESYVIDVNVILVRANVDIR